MIEVRSISLSFDRPVLHNVSLTLKKGQIIGIAGKSGAGKSSLLKILAGLLDPTTGNVYMEGKKLPKATEKLVPGHPEIQLVNQDYKLDIHQSVEENIRTKILYLPLKERDELIEELLNLTELGELRKQKALSLSGGEQQRLAIARALALEPAVLLLDEPFAHLDGRLKSKLIRYMRDLREIRNCSFVLVSHDGAEMLGMADEILIMENGSVVKNETPENCYYEPKSEPEALLFGAVNEIELHGEKVLFRPDEFLEVVANEDGIVVNFQESLFTGPVVENYFLTDKNETIVLFAFKSLKHVSKIKVSRKNA